MKVLGTRSDKWGSRFMRWGLEEPVSHVAVELSNGFIIHAHLLGGLQIDWARDFRRDNEVVYELETSMLPERETVQALLDAHAGSGYDYWAFTYFGWRVILRKFFNIPLPRQNRWARRHAFMCTEWLTVLLGQGERAMITPFQLIKELADGRV